MVASSESDPTEIDAQQPESDPDFDPQQARRRLEAVLLMSRGSLSTRKLGQLASLEDGTQARTMIRELNEQYDRSGQAFHIKRVAGGYQMLTRPQFARWIERLQTSKPHPRLSRSALETLTIVAYRQPVIKVDIEAIRGVSCGEMLRQLLEAGLIRIAGRSENLGRPYLYGTTREFLESFGLASLRDLPRADQLSGQGLPAWPSPDENLGNHDSGQENSDQNLADDEPSV